MSIKVKIISGQDRLSVRDLPVDEAVELTRQGIARIIDEDYLSKQATDTKPQPVKEDTATVEDVSALTVKELKTRLEALGLDTKGNKKALVKRLNQHKED